MINHYVSQYVHSGLPPPPNRRKCLQPNFMFITFICHPAARPTVHEYRLLYSVLSGFQHRLSGTRCHNQFSSVILSRFQTIFCSIRLFAEHWSDLLPAPVRLRLYGAVEIRLLLLLLLLLLLFITQNWNPGHTHLKA